VLGRCLVVRHEDEMRLRMGIGVVGVVVVDYTLAAVVWVAGEELLHEA